MKYRIQICHGVHSCCIIVVCCTTWLSNVVFWQDGSAYRLHHSAACPLALSRLLSFLAATMRHSAGLTPFVGHNDSNSNEPHANDSYSSDTYISYNQNGNSSANVSLASNVSAWLKPWPAVEGTGGGCWDWVSVLLLGLALTLTPAANAVRMVRERKVGGSWFILSIRVTQSRVPDQHGVSLLNKLNFEGSRPARCISTK